MFRQIARLAVTAAFFLTAGCGKRSTVVIPVAKEAGAAATVDSLPAVATHLGFATRVPKDVDVFISGYHQDEMVRGLVSSLDGLLPMVDHASDGAVDREEELRKAMSYAGDEMFFFIGPGAGSQLEMVGKTYRDISSAWAGIVVGAILDAASKKDSAPDLSKLTDGLSDGLLDKWLEVMEKDSKLKLPSLVAGWRPSIVKQAECIDAVKKGLDQIFQSSPGAGATSFVADGVTLSGYEIPGKELFGEAVEEAREKLKDNPDGDELLKQISPERMDHFLAALEDVRFTIATGVVDGRVLIYVGNGKEGFRLAGTPADSLAATEDLRWMDESSDKHVSGVFYLSEPVVRAALPWLDSSAYYQAVAASIKPPVREERLIRGLLGEIADTDANLAKRDASAWSAVICEDSGWKFESRGGWPDPSLDYETPLRMTDAALAAKPAIRAQWVQNRGRKNLEWKQMENFGMLVESVIGELQTSNNSMMAMIPEGTVPRLMDEVRGIHRACREGLQEGMGDEVAVVVDFQGMVPTVPGISEDTVKNAKAPRFVFARPVTDRAKVAEAGDSLVKSWRSLTSWASELSGENLPLILPQSLESGGLVTWYPPLPFIGGDFVPGVTLNDEVWMLGTSRSMAAEFSKYLKTSGSGDEKGMIVEVDFQAIRQWSKDIYQRNATEADLLADEVPEEMQKFAKEENLKLASSAADRIHSIGYRKWMAGGKPRTSLHLRFNPK